MQERIEYVEWAVANKFSDGIIEMHKDLNNPEWKKLHDKILNHERDHDFKKGFFYNAKVDFLNFIGVGGLLHFMIRRPKTWVQISPIYYTKQKGLVYDKNMLLFYIIIALGIYVVIKFFGGI